MTGFEVAGGVLLAHAEGSTKQAENFSGLERLLEQARVSDDCFGPLFPFLRDGYFESLQQCQEMAAQAASYLEQVSQAVSDVATAYGATETDNATGLANIDTGVGDLGSLNSAGDSTRRNDFEQASGYGSSFADAAYSAADQVRDPGNPVEVAFATFNARAQQLDLVTSPGQAFVDNGLGWLISIVISPLVNFVLEPALGDPEQMRSTGKGWEGVAGWLERAAEAEQRRADGTAQAWSGEAGDAFRAEMAEFAEGARAMSGDIADLKSTLDTAAELFDTFVQVVIDIIQELVIGLIIEWLAALAASWITAGASVGAASALTTAQVTTTGGRLSARVAQLQRRLYQLFQQLERMLVALRASRLGQRVLTSTRHLPRSVGNPALRAFRGHGDDLATASGNRFFGSGATGAEALAQRTVSAGLGYLGLGGTTNTGKLLARGTLENVPGAAIEWGAGQAYDHAQDPSTDEERRAAQDRGFTLDE